MPFINNTKFKEIRGAGKNGNEQALMILQALRKNSPQDEIDRLVGDYYGASQIVPSQTENPLEAMLEPKKEEIQDQEGVALAGNVPEEEIEENHLGLGVDSQGGGGISVEEELTGNTEDTVPTQPATIDLTETLDGEMDGLLDENELEDLSFNDFLKNKSRDSLRLKKDSNYFKAFDADGRKNYLDSKTNKYKEKFNGRLGNINRHFTDNETSINNYIRSASELLDDNIGDDMNSVNSAYDDFTKDELTMNSFGRHWDDNDNNVITLSIKELAKKYGKNNVVSALNVLKSDNEAYRDFLNNQVDEEVNRYSKSLEKLLK